jgi:predicted KAP-like P-loop ATPase
VTGLFRADRALRNPEDDRLGYPDFPLAIAQSVAGLNPHDGLVLAIYGPWGSGKSTLLNFIEFELNKTATTEVIASIPGGSQARRHSHETSSFNLPSRSRNVRSLIRG